MPNKTIVITGASDGVGAAAARALHAEGHEIVIVGRSPQKTAQVAGELDSPSYTADFAELDQVRALADTLQRNHPRIDVLANNAGGIFGERTITVDGNEQIMQVNHLAPLLLTTLLLDQLLEHNAAVITTSSAGNRFAKLDTDDLDTTQR